MIQATVRGSSLRCSAFPLRGVIGSFSLTPCPKNSNPQLVGHAKVRGGCLDDTTFALTSPWKSSRQKKNEHFRPEEAFEIFSSTKQSWCYLTISSIYDRRIQPPSSNIYFWRPLMANYSFRQKNSGHYYKDIRSYFSTITWWHYVLLFTLNWRWKGTLAYSRPRFSLNNEPSTISSFRSVICLCSEVKNHVKWAVTRWRSRYLAI